RGGHWHWRGDVHRIQRAGILGEPARRTLRHRPGLALRRVFLPDTDGRGGPGDPRRLPDPGGKTPDVPRGPDGTGRRRRGGRTVRTGPLSRGPDSRRRGPGRRDFGTPGFGGLLLPPPPRAPGPAVPGLEPH